MIIIMTIRYKNRLWKERIYFFVVPYGHFQQRFADLLIETKKKPYHFMTFVELPKEIIKNEVHILFGQLDESAK